MFQHQVVSNRILNNKFNLLTFRCKAKNWNFKIGQFVLIQVGKNITRAYSIASLPDKLPLWQIFVDITPQGPGTTYLKALKARDIILTSDATGQFILSEKGNQYLFAATGCGIAPFIPMVKSCLNNNKKVHLFWGLRRISEIALRDAIAGWSKNNNFSYDIILSQPESVWKGKTGHIQQFIPAKIKSLGLNNLKVYLSGSRDFIKQTSIILKAGNIPTKKIYFEACY